MKTLKKAFTCILLGLLLCLPVSGGVPKAGIWEVQAAASTPATPRLISATPSGRHKITIKWQKVSGANGYKIYRGTTSSLKAVKILENGSRVSYVDSNLATGVRYYYTIRAYKIVNGKVVWSDYDKKGLKAIPGISLIKLNKTQLTLNVNKTAVLKLTNTKLSPQWSSSNTSVATVNSSGTVTARKAGSATITATLDSKKLRCKVTVKAPADTAAAGKNKLKNYIEKNGVINKNGKRVINGSDILSGTKYTWGIVYDKAYDRFRFLMLSDFSEGATGGLKMFLPLKATSAVTPDYIWMVTSGAGGFEAKASIKITEYTRNSNVSFSIVDSAGLSSSGKQTARKLANKELQIGFLGWQALLKMAGVSFKAIGFTNYI